MFVVRLPIRKKPLIWKHEKETYHTKNSILYKKNNENATLFDHWRYKIYDAGHIKMVWKNE